MLFKHFRTREMSTLEDTFAAQQRMITLLLVTMVEHAVRGDAADFALLETDITSFREAISSENLDSSDLLTKTATALTSLKEYNRRTSDFHLQQAFELQKITAMMTGTIVNLSVAGSTNVARLQSLEKQLERAGKIDDIRMLKERLGECLIGIREEKFRQQASSEGVIHGLNGTLDSAAPRTISLQSLDVTTGLGSRPAAELAIANCSDNGGTFYAALFVIDHLHGLNTRYGRAVGDQIIMSFAQHLAQNLRPEDAVFRWSGPAFLTLVERDDSLEKARRSLAPVTNARLEKMVQSRDRTVLLPINFSWTLVPVSTGGRACVTVDRLDAFLTSKVGSEA